MPHLLAIAQYVQTHALSIVLAIIVSYGIGFLWHGPLFGKQWMHLNKLPMPKKEDMKFSMMLPGLSANLVLVFVESAVLGRTFQIVSLPSIWQALLVATIIWLPFTALVLANIYAWSGKSWKVWVLDAGHSLAAIWGIAAVLYVTL